MSSTAPGLGRRLASNTLHAATGRLASVLVWLLFAPALLEALGPAGFGVWALFFALTGHLAALDFGLVQATLRHVSAARERGDAEEAEDFATLGLLGFAALGLAWGLAVWLLGDAVLEWLRVPADLLPAAAFAVSASAPVFVFLGAANVLMAVTQAHGRFDLANAVSLSIAGQQAVGIPLVLHFHGGLRGLVLNVGIGWVLGAGLGLALLPRAAPGMRLRSPARALARLRRAAAFGLPLQLTSLLTVANQHLDKFLLSRFVGLASVTPYELGARVATAAITFPQFLLLAVLPAASALHAAGDTARLRELYERGGRLVLVATAVTTAALLAAAPRLFSVWLGGGYDGAALALRGVAAAWAVAMTAGMASAVARGIARTDLEAWFHVASTTVHALLSLWLLPGLGMSGALVAYVAGHAAGALLFLRLLASALRWPFARVMLAPLVCPAAACAAGTLAGLALDRWLPARQAGVEGWMWLGLVAASAAGAALATALLWGYVRPAELRRLLAARP
jgi:O-antigen/teichoic acid export membrane protein